MGLESNRTPGALSAAQAARCRDIRNEGLLPEAMVDLIEGVLPLQDAARAEARIVVPPRGDMATVETLMAGGPLLPRQAFPRDTRQALELLPRLLDLLAATSGEAAEAATALRAALAPGGGLDATSVLNALCSGDEAVFLPWRERFPGAPRALDFAATCALAPGLAKAAEQLAPLLPPDLPHEHGGCPLCGSLPHVTFLDGKEGRRMAACSFCGHEYRVRRVACAYCGEDDQQKLRLFTVAEYPGARVEVCDSCGMYAKTLDHRDSDKGNMPALDDMATVALDMLARRQGYSRPVLSAWGF